ncbi:unnamed protein product [Blepharisma stoltei]|uniref:UBC core domain-containing protein n=1 Tax=Blepharisma stoltei TaxID=1481888 RepID=A0AAU9IUB3_9CILI|nr:unnamed protein product [Blepharisma stoltei]
MERLILEYNSLHQQPIQGVSLEIGLDFQHWQGVFIGPEDSPFENGRFRYEIIFPSNYPENPPEFFIKTKIFHPNISAEGNVCCDLIGSGWSSRNSVRSIFYGVFAVLSQPNAKNGYLNEALEIFLKSKDEYDREASNCTRKYAK